MTEKKSEKLNKSSKNAKLDDIDVIFKEEMSKEGFSISVGPEVKYVRRPKEEFDAGATPVSGTSHRMSKVGVFLSQELQDAVRLSADEANMSVAMWLRAAVRMALREGMNAETELNSSFEVTPKSGDRTPSDP